MDRAKCLPDAAAEIVARLGLLDCVGRFGVPLQIITDGEIPSNELCDQLMILMRTERLESFHTVTKKMDS